MKTFNFKAVYSQLLTPEIVFRLTQLHEYKGRLNRLLETDAAALSEIKETAALQTVAASNRMEGITVAEDRLKKLILNKTNPQTDDEKKVAGYRDVLTSISANYDFLPPAPSTILQLHRDLYKLWVAIIKIPPVNHAPKTLLPYAMPLNKPCKTQSLTRCC
mgnify:CR=1 FL=1